MIEKFAEDAVALHKQARTDWEEAMLASMSSSYSWVRGSAGQAMTYYEGVLHGIEQTVALLLGQEKTEEVLGLSGDDESLVLA